MGFIHITFLMERVTGVEPVSSVWKTEAQPLYQTRIELKTYLSIC